MLDIYYVYGNISVIINKTVDEMVLIVYNCRVYIQKQFIILKFCLYYYIFKCLNIYKYNFDILFV